MKLCQGLGLVRQFFVLRKMSFDWLLFRSGSPVNGLFDWIVDIKIGRYHIPDMWHTGAFFVCLACDSFDPHIHCMTHPLS